MRRNLVIATLCLLAALAGRAQTPTADYRVVPLPRAITMAGGAPFILTDGKSISAAPGDTLLRRDAEFLRDYVRQYTGIQLAIVDRRGDIQLSTDNSMSHPEGYTIAVSSRRVSIKGRTAAGVFRAVQTLRKSLRPCARAIALPAATLSDAPRFAYRGLMLDCARHFFPVRFVKQCIDLMALHGLNTFHWHLTDDQGWRIEVRRYPRLTTIGSRRDMTVVGHNTEVYDSTAHGGYYTQEEAREVVRYAAERHITVIPEVDMPGHMMGALAAYPELGCTGGPYHVWTRWGISDDVLCLGNPKVYTFCQDVLSELMDIFPSHYIHIGGDETPTVRWEHCPRCEALARREGVDARHLQSLFTARMEQWVEQHGRAIIGWDEVMLSPQLSSKTVVMSWRGAKPGAEAAERGHDVIMSPADHCYLNFYQVASQQQTMAEPPAYDAYLPIERVYEFEPVAPGASPRAAAHIIGVQANLWTEYVDCPALALYQLLPRLGAVSEVQWVQPGSKDLADFRARAASLRLLYDHLHLPYGKQLWGK